MTIDIEDSLEACSHRMCCWELRMLVEESYCVLIWTIILSVPCGVVPGFVESVAVFSLLSEEPKSVFQCRFVVSFSVN